METKEQRQKRIKTMLDSGIKNFDTYVRQHKEIIDSDTYSKAMEYYELSSQSAKIYESLMYTYKMLENIYSGRDEVLTGNDRTISQEIDYIWARVQEANKEELGHKLANDAEALQEIHKKLEELTPSYKKYSDIVSEEASEKHNISRASMDNYVEILVNIPTKDRKSFILEDLETALKLIKEDNKYFNKLLKDIKRAKPTIGQKDYASIAYINELGTKQKEQIDAYTRISATVELYIYAFQSAYLMENLNELNAKDNTSQDLIDSFNAMLLEKIIKEKAELPKEPLEVASILSGTSFLIPFDKRINMLSIVSGKKAELESMGLDYTLETERYKVTRKTIESNKIAKSYGVPTDKLFRAILGEFMRVNKRTPEINKNAVNTHLHLDMLEYAKATGVNLVEEVKNTPEEQGREKRRIAERKKEFRRKIIEYLENISHEQIKWKDKKLNEKGAFIILDSYKVNGRTGKIDVVMGQTFSQTLLDIKTPLTKQHTCLLRVDNNNSTAYQIGLKLQTHYNMYPNVNKGTNTLISISSLLESTSLSTMEELDAIGKTSRWAERIKAPLENALDYLYSQSVGICFLKDYRYSHAKHEPLSEEELIRLDHGEDYKCEMSFDEWKELYIEFEIEEPSENREQRVVEAKAWRKPKTRKKGGKSSGTIKKKSQNNPKTQGKEIKQ